MDNNQSDHQPTGPSSVTPGISSSLHDTSDDVKTFTLSPPLKRHVEADHVPQRPEAPHPPTTPLKISWNESLETLIEPGSKGSSVVSPSPIQNLNQPTNSQDIFGNLDFHGTPFRLPLESNSSPNLFSVTEHENEFALSSNRTKLDCFDSNATPSRGYTSSYSAHLRASSGEEVFHSQKDICNSNLINEQRIPKQVSTNASESFGASENNTKRTSTGNASEMDGGMKRFNNKKLTSEENVNIKLSPTPSSDTCLVAIPSNKNLQQHLSNTNTPDVRTKVSPGTTSHHREMHSSVSGEILSNSSPFQSNEFNSKEVSCANSSLRDATSTPTVDFGNSLTLPTSSISKFQNNSNSGQYRMSTSPIPPSAENDSLSRSPTRDFLDSSARYRISSSDFDTPHVSMGSSRLSPELVTPGSPNSKLKYNQNDMDRLRECITQELQQEVSGARHF
jgi:hypothetical protein